MGLTPGHVAQVVDLLDRLAVDRVGKHQVLGRIGERHFARHGGQESSVDNEAGAVYSVYFSEIEWQGSHERVMVSQSVERKRTEESTDAWGSYIPCMYGDLEARGRGRKAILPEIRPPCCVSRLNKGNARFGFALCLFPPFSPPLPAVHGARRTALHAWPESLHVW